MVEGYALKRYMAIYSCKMKYALNSYIFVYSPYQRIH